METPQQTPVPYPFWWTFFRYSCYWISPLAVEFFTLQHEIKQLPSDSGAGFFLMAYIFALPQLLGLALAGALITTLATRRMSRGTADTRQVLGWLQMCFIIIFSLILIFLLSPTILRVFGFNF